MVAEVEKTEIDEFVSIQEEKICDHAEVEKTEIDEFKSIQEEKTGSVDAKNKIMMKKMKKNKALMEAREKRGVCHLSRIPPHMDPTKLRQILSHYADILRIYLMPENPEAQIHRKMAGGFRGQQFSEGWVEFEDKRVAKRVAEMLNGEQIGGKKRSSFHYDIWNIKYLSKYKWDDLTGETAYQKALREQKLELHKSVATKQKKIYLERVGKARAFRSIDERLKKKQKIQQETGENLENPVTLRETKVFRRFPQTKPIADNAGHGKSRISKDILAGVFGGSL